MIFSAGAGPGSDTAGRNPSRKAIITDIPVLGIHDQQVRSICCLHRNQGSKCTIIWHVYDLQISHVENAVVEDIIN